MSEQAVKSFSERQAQFNRIRALILKIVASQPGLTVEGISQQFQMEHGFLPRIENRLREARSMGWVESKAGADCRLHWYPKEEEA